MRDVRVRGVSRRCLHVRAAAYAANLCVCENGWKITVSSLNVLCPVIIMFQVPAGDAVAAAYVVQRAGVLFFGREVVKTVKVVLAKTFGSICVDCR